METVYIEILEPKVIGLLEEMVRLSLIKLKRVEIVSKSSKDVENKLETEGNSNNQTLWGSNT